MRGHIIGSMLLAMVASAACGDTAKPRSSQDLAQSVCRIVRSVDADCDHVVNEFDRHPGANDWTFDEDGDGAVDPIDRFPGDDFADFDHDGWVNWADALPYDAAVTISQMLSTSNARQAAAYERNRLINESRRFDRNNAARAVVLREMDRNSRDSDGDGIADIYDTHRTYPTTPTTTATACTTGAIAFRTTSRRNRAMRS